MVRELLNKDGTPMREYHSEIIEKLLNEPKQTAVEWLIDQLIFKQEYEHLPNNYFLMSDKDIDNIIQQAKEMEKEQHEHSYLTCYEEYTAEGKHWEMGMNPKETFEQYYNETYN